MIYIYVFTAGVAGVAGGGGQGVYIYIYVYIYNHIYIYIYMNKGMQVSFATLREEISTDFYCQDNSPNKKMSSYPSIHQFGFGSWCLLTQRKEILSRLCPIKKCATR